MKYKAKNKSLSKIKFLLTVLVLSGGLLAGAKLVQTKQESNVNASTIYVGTPLSSNSYECRIAGGVCATFNTAQTSSLLYSGSCSVNGVTGRFLTGKCPGDWRTSCCNTGTSCYVGGFIIPNGTKFCNTSARTRVYVCSSGSIVYRGSDCASFGKICEYGNCVTKLSGTGTGAERCVTKGGNCQTYIKSTLSTISTPTEGAICMTGNKVGKYQSSDGTNYLCSGQYLTSYRCCVPN